MLSEGIEKSVHICGQRSLESHHLLCCRVFEFDAEGVERNAAKKRLGHDGLGVGQLPEINQLAAVHVVGDDRVPYI